MAAYQLSAGGENNGNMAPGVMQWHISWRLAAAGGSIMKACRKWRG